MEMSNAIGTAVLPADASDIGVTISATLLLLREVAGERTPRDRDVDIVAGDGVDQLARRIRVSNSRRRRYSRAGSRQIPRARERLRRRHIVVVVADDMDTDAQTAQARIVERLQSRAVPSRRVTNTYVER